jgi:hypothetical protein
MAQLPTPEDCGRKVLAYYKLGNLRPGEAISIPSLRARWMGAGLRADDLQAGLKWLVAQAYLRPEQRDTMFHLTESGFAAM